MQDNQKVNDIDIKTENLTNRGNIESNIDKNYDPENKNEGIPLNHSSKNEKPNTEYNLKDMISQDPLDFINISESAIITQVIDKDVFLSGCEPAIRYIITLTNSSRESKKIFNCREVNDWCQKNCYQ